MSILDSVRLAEEKAEKLKAEATEKAKLLLEKTKVCSEEKANKMLEQAMLEEKKLDEEAFTKINLKEREINLLLQNEEKKLDLAANDRMDKVIDFIIKKVFEL